MQKNNLKIVAFLITLVIASAAFAASGDLSIKIKKNADLLNETKLVSLKDELTIDVSTTKRQNQLAFGASVLSLGHPQINVSDRSSEYSFSSGTAVGFEYSQYFNNARLTATAGYDTVEQDRTIPTRLHILPVGILGEYVFLKDRKISPFVGIGALEMIEIQRGTDIQNVTQTDTLPVYTVGAEIKTPWGYLLHARARRVDALAKASKEWAGQIYDIGVAYSM